MGLSQDAIIRNHLLAALPHATLAAILPKLTQVPMLHRQTFFKSDAPIEAVFFPVSGMFSLVADMEDGSRAEIGVIGHEGMLGVSLLSGADSSFAEAMVQMPGTALRLSVRDFRQEVASVPPFRALMLSYAEALQAQIMQTAACNGRHSLEQRLARWLLMAQDRAEGVELPLTQEFLAIMLGVHRPSVSVAAAVLQRDGIIRYSSGRITVLDRPGLEAASCECYAAVQRRYASLLGAVTA